MQIGAHVSSSGGIDKAIDRAVAIDAESVQVFTQSPRTWRPTNHDPASFERFREKRTEAGIGGVVCHALYLCNLAAPDDAVVREVRRRAAQHDGGRLRDRRGRRRLPRRLASRQRLRDGPRARGARAGAGAGALLRRDVAADGELGRRRRHDRALGLRARRDLGAARQASPARRVPRLLSPLGVRRRRDRPGARSTPASTSSTPRSASTACARCMSTTPRHRSARTATGTRTSSKASSARSSACSSPTRDCRDCRPCSRPQAPRTAARTRTRSARRRSCARAGSA